MRRRELDPAVRAAFREHLMRSLARGRRRARLFPGFKVPRAELIDLVIAPTEGTLLCIYERSDYVAAYRRPVGQIVGTLTHFQRMSLKQLADGLRIASAGRALASGRRRVDPLRAARRVVADRGAGAITVALVTDIPWSQLQAETLQLNLEPVVEQLRSWLRPRPGERPVCRTLELVGVDARARPPSVGPLFEMLVARRAEQDARAHAQATE